MFMQGGEPFTLASDSDRKRVDGIGRDCPLINKDGS